MNELIEKMIAPVFANPALLKAHDGSVVNVQSKKIAMTTDSYVIHPLFFPGGDIGSLAVHGTVNDLAMCGAKPLYMSVGFILEEGLPMETLWQVIRSIKEAAQKSGIQIVTGDTKVVDKGKADGIFINTTGVGAVEHKLDISPQSVKKGDAIILSGDIGRHGIAIMAVREGLEFETKIESDSAPLWNPIKDLLKKNIRIHCLRDLTRGGLASALVEISKKANVAIQIDERAIPVREDVKGACEILGFDPLYVANEGRFICFVDGKEKDAVLKILGKSASLIGTVMDSKTSKVTLKSFIGTTRIVDMLSGDQLPRIC